MEEVAFNDWPGQPVDLNSGGNSWLPAYGFQMPPALLEREDFIGNPDADYFLQGSSTQCLYLETIHEETSDDLRSDSDISEVRGSSLGWLNSDDSEADSVICLEVTNDSDSESDREIACPVKRRRQENLLTLPVEDEYQSLSRSSSLLQFETLEKQCQETSSSSPSIYSQFSYDSLEVVPISRPQLVHRPEAMKDSSSSDSSDTGDSETTLMPSKSCSNLMRTWHSFESLPNKTNNRISAENLSEDSGYSDHMSKQQVHVPKIVCWSVSSPEVVVESTKSNSKSSVGFEAYDCEVFLQQFSGNFGASCQNLNVIVEDDDDDDGGGSVVKKWMRATDALNLERTTPTSASECEHQQQQAKYNCTSASEPNLSHADARRGSSSSIFNKQVYNLLEQSVCVCCSVPTDLNLSGTKTAAYSLKDEWSFQPEPVSIAAKNWDLADFATASITKESLSEEYDMASYRREGSYSEAMRDRVDLSDDETSLRYRKPPKTTLEAFDKKILTAISESIQSINSASRSTSDVSSYPAPAIAPTHRSVASTPNLHDTDADSEIMDILMQQDDRRRSAQDLVRKSSLVNHSALVCHSTSTSGVSDYEEKTLMGSSKGVHFSPVVSEVNWRDDSQTSSTATPEPESSFSLSSTPERDIDLLAKRLLNPSLSPPPPTAHAESSKYNSQPDLNPPMPTMPEQSPRYRPSISQSQPDVRMKRRGSQLIKKDKDGCVIKAYVDGDGIQYRHSHLDLDDVYGLHGHGSGDLRTAVGSSAPGAATTRAAAPASVAPSPGGHVARGGISGAAGAEVKRGDHAVAGMDAVNAVTKEQHHKSRAGKLGGFFSRLASFRFSNRKGADSKKRSSSKTGDSQQQHRQKIATKDDYIYIPLKGPSSASQEGVAIQRNGSQGAAAAAQNGHAKPQQQENVSWKPPLPRVPPRVVGASVKREGQSAQGPPHHHHHHRQHHHHHPEQEHQRRRRTIDSGESCPRPMEPMGLIETDLDTEVTVITSGANVKTRSLLNLGAEPRLGLLTVAGSDVDGAPTTRPHKSMEFLLDKQNLKVVEPPENELQKSERVMSEHQLRVQRSLQKLTIPDWYKQSQVPREGFLLKKQSNRESRWTGTGSKTTSLSSLGSSGQSPVVLSPTSAAQPFVRWSTSKLNSTASSPCASTRSSFNVPRHHQPNGSVSPAASVRSSFSYRQPYMGWRSQERLSKPRTPAERLANSLLSQQDQRSSQTQHLQESPEIQTSIKEVTSAIVHYVSGLRPDGEESTRSRSVSPRGSQKLCWLESSFVGIRPLDSPQTPVTLSESGQTPAPPTSLRLELQTHNDVTLLNTGSGPRPSPGSTTLEDVLDSLLGLPSSERAPSPSLQATASANTSPSRLGECSRTADQFRRRSEGNEPAPMLPDSRRASFQGAPPLLQCRYNRCGKVATLGSPEAATFKNCHNCSYTYCSRTCRRAHWEKHRKTCLFSRIGTLCRQVIAAIKEQKDTLLHLSWVARRGYLSHGLGAVKCFFPCPEAAEKFLTGGLSCLGELTYVRWADLLPSEMGTQLYTELVQMCKNYNADSKLVLYVCVCVVSETPATGAVKWERQLVSRCAKMRLSKDISIPDKDQQDNPPETLVLMCNAIEVEMPAARKKLKEMTVNNVLKQLYARGVSLKRQHPSYFKQLRAYANGSCEKFTPITVYPKDLDTGKAFMCIIMLEADEDSLRQVELAGVRVRTVDVMCE